MTRERVFRHLLRLLPRGFRARYGDEMTELFLRRLEVPVVLTDIDQERVDKGVGYVHAEIEKLLGKGRINQDKANRL